MKSLTLVLCVIALLGSAASTFFYFQIGDTKTKLQQQVTLADNRTTDVQAKLSDANGQIDALQKRLASMDSDLGDAKSKLTSADNHSVELARNVDQLTNQVTAKEDAIKSLNEEVAGLKRDLGEAKLNAVSPEEIDNYKKTIASLQDRVAELMAGKTTVVAADGTSQVVAAPASAGLSGQVVSVGTQNAFVVLNLGSAQGVQVNQKFTITRGGNTLATAAVSSVEASYSIAQIATDSLRGDLGKGDIATVAQ
ncbi:MAG TPA: hypothetical protein VL357_12345 [Rariglobus sp.]|jgi:peptidoglycan hydrolase CwlO-like protein|nr:hypothetical protein [Rariglobus sp.]